MTLCRQSVITKRDASIKLNGSGVRKRAGGTFSPRPGLRRSAGQIPNPPPQCVDKPQNVSFRASDPGRLLLPQKALLSLRDQSADWSWQSVGLLRQFTFCAHLLQVLGDEGALELVRAFGRFAMTEYLLCLQSEQPAKGGCLLWRREAESKR